MRPLHTFAFALSLLGAIPLPPAHADNTATEKAYAQALFDEGKALMDKSDFGPAAKKFEASHKIQAAWGAVFNAAVCNEQVQRTGTAWLQFHEALTMARKAKRADRETQTLERIDALKPKLSMLTVIVPPAAESPGLEIKVDDVPIARDAWGTAAPLDPGTHVVVASSVGKTPFRATIELKGDADRKTITIEKLNDVAGATPVSIDGTKPKPASDHVRESSSSRRTIGWIVGGAGLVALSAGGFFAYRAHAMHVEADDLGREGKGAEAYARADDARGANTLARIGLGVGVLAVGVGAYFVITSPATTKEVGASKLSIGVASGAGLLGLSLGGAW